MKRPTGKIEVSDASGIGRGTVLTIGEGNETDVVHVRSVRGTTVKVGRLGRRHRLAWRLRSGCACAKGSVLVAAKAAQETLCGWRGHRLTREGPIAGYRNRLRYCWCSEQRQRVPEWPVIREDGTEISEAGRLSLMVPPGHIPGEEW